MIPLLEASEMTKTCLHCSRHKATTCPSQGTRHPLDDKGCHPTLHVVSECAM